ncbi:putative UBC5-E2 ubiquitin-conjugating enzyme [Jaminaea rosea]|uniref:E2 ubiquitin-conjugating enzyme n=1 Tax=Jaminaea rosea TaxID=1569628 RepID=A0A316UUP6_9BASI|nr:putative UBC5-E2 ubiquitin-conjugating enzyme [Jaminaea rosea]PWN26835.1 putative UBC5-E2 ubiquitin-conjugating enzyme [Jaminaea rosea]
MASSKRITKELADLSKEPLPGIAVSASEANVYQWQAVIAGPADSPYAKGSFNLSLEFPAEYPFKGPKVRFATKIYHPNVDEEGAVCLGILKSEAWKPSTKAATVLQSIQNLLSEPDPDDALVASIAELYKKDRPQFDHIAKETTKKYAMA